MKNMTWKSVLLLVIAISIVNIVAGHLGGKAAETENERKARSGSSATANASIRTLVSSQDAEGVTQEQLDLDALKNLESYTVQRATIKAKEHLASAGYPNSEVHYTSEAIYVESGSMKLAVIRLKARGTRQVLIVGIVGEELKRVLCQREAEEAIPLSYGPCSEKIREVFGVTLGG